MIPGVYVCGTGNLATALYTALRNNGLQAQVYSRTPQVLNGVATLAYGQDVPAPGSFVFLSVTDSAIADLARFFTGTACTLIHCSGSVPMQDEALQVQGVFYPLQTFSKAVLPSWKGLPVLLEATDDSILQTLKTLAETLGATWHAADSQQRSAIHLAAVFANNFSNAMFGIAEKLSEKSGFPQDLLLPLVMQTTEKLKHSHALDAQTGPARRQDEAVLQKHLKMLEDEPELQEIYALMTQYITRQYPKK
ncbi:MAG: DUF2520 domain-containing protein [Bacteroidetes bacterium]|nr:DUF2520 domain-containing protein [Bacteroidota bacterium]